MQAAYTLKAKGQVHVFDMNSLPWQATANPGLWLKPVRHDDKRGHYLGLVKFDPYTRSGLHQHQGVATSLVIEGGLSDHHGSICLHDAGINVKGSTHDAIAYQPTVLVSRLEGPVIYPKNSDISGVHAGSRHKNFRNPDPEVPPEVNVPVDQQHCWPTGVAGVLRQMIFDYADTGSQHRMVQLTVRPESAFGFTATALTEFWVRGGQIEVNGKTVCANSFVVCETGAKVRCDSPFGVQMLGWADAREKGPGNLFGF